MKLINELRNEINREITITLKKFCDIPIAGEMLGYQLGLLKNQSTGAQGKRFRPVLCLLTAKAISGSYKKALPAAVAIELIHNFSLIHDDIQDGDEFRRGRQTVWRKWGANQAINAGDAMHALVGLALSGLFDSGLKPAVINSVSSAVNSACYRMCEGQMLDLSFEKRARVGIGEYLRMIREKTAALIESAPVSGALVSTQNCGIIKCYRSFGANAGMAFQIFNDISGFGDKGSRSLHIQSDLKKNKKTLPFVLALGAGKKGASGMRVLIVKTGALRHSEAIGTEYLRKALYDLDRSGVSNSAQDLLKDYVLHIKD